MKYPICKDSRDCFAHDKQGKENKCMILSETKYEDGECPFCKPDKEITNGIRYPYDPDYAGRMNGKK